MAVVGLEEGMTAMFNAYLRTATAVRACLLEGGSYVQAMTSRQVAEAELLTAEGYSRATVTFSEPVSDGVNGGVSAPLVTATFTKAASPSTPQQFDAVALLVGGSAKANVAIASASGSPTTLNSTGHGFVAGDLIYFTTTGTFPSSVTAGTAFFVSATGLTANAFQISSTAGGASLAIGTSWTGTLTARNASGKAFMIQTNPIISGTDVVTINPGQSVAIRIQLGQRAVEI